MITQNNSGWSHFFYIYWLQSRIHIFCLSSEFIQGCCGKHLSQDFLKYVVWKSENLDLMNHNFKCLNSVFIRSLYLLYSVFSFLPFLIFWYEVYLAVYDYWLITQIWCSDPSTNGGRCLRKKWLNLGIRNGTVYTRAEILTIDMIWNHSGHASQALICL